MGLAHTEILVPRFSLVDRDTDADALDPCRHFLQVNDDAFIVTFAGLVISCMRDRTITRFQVVIKNEVRIGAHLSICLQQECAAIKVEGSAVGRARIPAEADHNFLQVRGGGAPRLSI